MFKPFMHSRLFCRQKGSLAAVISGLFLTSICLSAPPNIKHTMLVSGTGLDYVGIVDTTGKVVWKHVELESTNGQKNDCWLLPNGNVVYAYQWGVRIVNVRTNQVVWDRPTPKRNNQSGETHSCQPLESGSGKFLIPECFPDTAFIVEVDTAKKEWRRIALKNQGGGTHGKWRQIRKTPQNTYLVSSYDLHHSYEYDTTGQLIHDFPSGGYVAQRLDNGNTLIGTGTDCRFLEYNAGGTQVWEINNTTAAVSGLGIGFASEVQRLPNGNTIITNWGGHGASFGAAVVEIKSDRTIVGAIPDSFPESIASVKIIDGWTFPAKQFTITASAGPNGSISPSGAVLADSGTNKTFSITAENGYAVDSVKVDGANVAAVGTFTFTAVSATHTIAAVFKKTVDISRNEFRQRSFTDKPLISVTTRGITISIPYSGTTEIIIFNCNGRKVLRTTSQGSKPCMLKPLAPGVYTVSCENSDTGKRWSSAIAFKGTDYLFKD